MCGVKERWGRRVGKKRTDWTEGKCVCVCVCAAAASVCEGWQDTLACTEKRRKVAEATNWVIREKLRSSMIT